MSELRVFTTRKSDIERCPKQSLLPGHYADDGTCNCTRKAAIDAELAAINEELDLIEARRQAGEERSRELVEAEREIRRTR